MKNFLLSLLIVPFFIIGCGSNDNNATFETPNAVPIVSDLSLNTSNNQTINISLISTDSDGDHINYEIVAVPTNGNASFSDEVLSYTPTLNFSGIDSFTYRAFDGVDYSEVKEVLIVCTININNTQPTVDDISGITNKNVSYVNSLSAHDIDGDILTYSVVSAPSNGIASFNGSVLTYIPDTDYFGNDSFTYKANDGIIDSSISAVDLIVNNINNAPLILQNSIPEGTEGMDYSYSIPVIDPDGDSFNLNISTVDSFGNSVAQPIWLDIDNLTGTISSPEIPINASSIIYLNIQATDSFGLVNSVIKPLNIVDYSTFDLTWNTENVGDSDDNTIGFYTELNPNNSIDWGDGVVETDLNNGVHSHSYAVPGIYTVRIIGAKFFESYGTNGGPRDNTKILSVDNWGSSQWISMREMFRGAVNLISNATDYPDVSNVRDMAYAFSGAISFNGAMNEWEVGSVKDMSYLFSGAISFNQPLNKWEVGNVSNMYYMFNDTPFNQDISSWDVSSVTNMGAMFQYTPFNQPIGSWDVSNVTSFASMFFWANAFNQDIGNWNTSSLISLSHTFYFAQQFNQDLSSWNTSGVTSLHNLFYGSAFNQPVNAWNTSNVVLFEGAFRGTPFNQPIGSWDVSNGVDLDYMFLGAADFNQDLSSWTPVSATRMDQFLNDAFSFSTSNYDLLLNSWSLLTLQNNTPLGVNDTFYTTATSDAARTSIITNFSWTITDAGGI